METTQLWRNHWQKKFKWWSNVKKKHQKRPIKKWWLSIKMNPKEKISKRKDKNLNSLSKQVVKKEHKMKKMKTKILKWKWKDVSKIKENQLKEMLMTQMKSSQILIVMMNSLLMQIIWNKNLKNLIKIRLVMI